MNIEQSNNKQEYTLLFQFIMASRWPLTFIISIGLISLTALQLLSRPIPIRLVGPLRVDRISLPTVKISSEAPLPVRGAVDVSNSVNINSNQPLPISGSVMVDEIKGDLNIEEIRKPVDVLNSSPFQVDGRVNVNGKVEVSGKVGAKVQPSLLPF